MATLIAVYTSDGCVGRCDARCYGAIEPECTCVCSGANHGVGYTRAAQNTLLYAQRWVDRHQASYPHHEVVVPGLQQELMLGLAAVGRRSGKLGKLGSAPPASATRLIRTKAELEHAALAPEFDFDEPDERQAVIDPGGPFEGGSLGSEGVDRG